MSIPILQIEPRDSLPAYLHPTVHTYLPTLYDYSHAFLCTSLCTLNACIHRYLHTCTVIPIPSHRTTTAAPPTGSPTDLDWLHFTTRAANNTYYKLSKQCCLSSASHRPRHSHLSRESAAVHTTYSLLASTFLLSLWRNNVQPGE